MARLLDAACIILSSVAAFAWRHGHVSLPLHYQMAIILGTLLAMVVFPIAGIYHSWRGKQMLRQTYKLAMVWLCVGASLIVFAFMMKLSEAFSRVWMMTWMVGGFGLLVSLRLILYNVLGNMRRRGWNHRRVVVIGKRQLGQEVAKRIIESPWLGLDVIALLDERQVLRHTVVSEVEDASELSTFVDREAIDEVWVALPLRADHHIKNILHALRETTVTVRFVPDIFESYFLDHKLTIVAGLPILDLQTSPMYGINRSVKAIEDRVLALILLIVMFPVVVILSIGVKLSSSGPILFKQRRHGWDGRLFTMYKFRTMVVHTEPDGQVTQACKTDDRITRFGAFLRRTSLDELPQLVNVLLGQMSIVGPRPHALAHNHYYKELVESYMQRHKVKPGMTGWAQVNGWRGETNTLGKMKKRIEHDLYYIENWSLSFDLKILFLTLYKGFLHPNAY